MQSNKDKKLALIEEIKTVAPKVYNMTTTFDMGCNLEAYVTAWFIKTSGCYSILRMKAAFRIGFTTKIPTRL